MLNPSLANPDMLNNEFYASPKKVLIIGLFPDSPRVRWISSPYVLKAYFERNSLMAGQIKIEVLNISTAEHFKKIEHLIIDSQAEIIAFSCYTWNIHIVRELIIKTREMLPSSKIILGGPEISLSNVDEYVNNPLASVDYCIIGEGEIAFMELLEEIIIVPPINTGKIRKSERVDLTKVPSIYLTETVPEDRYSGELVFLETQRGCTYKCAYCVYNKNLTGITYFSMKQIKEEITFLLTEKSITSIRIVDANFTSNLPKAKEILNHFIHLKTNGFIVKKLMIEYEYHNADEEFLSLIAQLKHSNLQYNYGKKNLPVDKAIGDSFLILDGYSVFSGVGIQSLNNDSLKAVKRRPFKTEEFESFLSSVKKYNIILKLDMILGLPYETIDTYIFGINKMLNYIKNTDHNLQLSFLQILPGSSLEASYSKLGLNYNKDTKFVYSSSTMNESEMLYCAKLSILINRILHSSLRAQFYTVAQNITDVNYMDLIINIYQKTCEKYINFNDLSTIEDVDQFNNKIFVKIQQSFLEDCLISF